MRDIGPRFVDERAQHLSTFSCTRSGARGRLSRLVERRVKSTRCEPGEKSEGQERFRANRSARRLPAETGSRNGRCGTRVRAIQLSSRPP